MLKVVQSDDTESSITDPQYEQHSFSNENRDERERENELENQTPHHLSETASDKRKFLKRARMQEDIGKKI